MKKTLLTLGLITTIGASAQTVTFEDLTLAPNTANDVSDDNGEFTSGGVTFFNVWTTSQWGDYWSAGFNYTNEVNIGTAGSATSYAGTGIGGSANYAVYYSGLDAALDFGAETNIASVAITNTTYAALSMKNGDAFAKKFGSSNNANGQPDGTNGKDYFKLLIIGLDADSLVTDTVEFYLADFRFADNALDYVVDEWTAVDLTPLGDIRYLAFDFESSDVGDFGINTPLYFAMDNLSFGTVGVSELTESFSLFPNPTTDKVTVQGNQGAITVFDATGKIVYTEQSNGISTFSTQNWNAGLYIVELRTANGTGRSTLVKN